MKLKILISLLCMFFVIGCGDNKHEINCEFQGGIVIGVSNFDDAMYDIKYGDKIISHAHGYQCDAGYVVGDTINKPCLGGQPAKYKVHNNNY